MGFHKVSRARSLIKQENHIMTINILVPNLGNEVTEAEISEWIFDEGEEVTEGEVLVVISTTKTSLEIEAPSGGRLALSLIHI